MTSVIAVANQKGGAGKTMTAADPGIGSLCMGTCVPLADADVYS